MHIRKTAKKLNLILSVDYIPIIETKNIVSSVHFE